MVILLVSFPSTSSLKVPLSVFLLRQVTSQIYTQQIVRQSPEFDRAERSGGSILHCIIFSQLVVRTIVSPRHWPRATSKYYLGNVYSGISIFAFCLYEKYSCRVRRVCITWMIIYLHIRVCEIRNNAAEDLRKRMQKGNKYSDVFTRK